MALHPKCSKAVVVRRCNLTLFYALSTLTGTKILGWQHGLVACENIRLVQLLTCMKFVSPALQDDSYENENSNTTL